MVVPMALASAVFPMDMVRSPVCPPAGPPTWLGVVACMSIPSCFAFLLGALSEVETADIATPRHFLDQGKQRRGGDRIISSDRPGRLERVEFGTRIERSEQQIVIGGKRTPLAAQLLNARVEEVAGAAAC